MMDSRKLVLKRGDNEWKSLFLHDMETGQPLAGQVSCKVIQDAHEPTKVVVTFLADPRLNRGVAIQCDDTQGHD